MADLDQSMVSYLLPVILGDGKGFRAVYDAGIGTLHIQGSEGHQWAEIHGLDGMRRFLHNHWGSRHTRLGQQPPRLLRARFAPLGLDGLPWTHVYPLWTGPYGGLLPHGLLPHTTTVQDSGECFLLGAYNALKLDEDHFEQQNPPEQGAAP